MRDNNCNCVQTCVFEATTPPTQTLCL